MPGVECVAGDECQAEAAFRVHRRKLEKHFPGYWATYDGALCIGITAYPTELTCDYPSDALLSVFHIPYSSSGVDPLLSSDAPAQIPPLSERDIQRLKVELFRRDSTERIFFLVRDAARKIWKGSKETRS